jgi:ABC-2 type transport system ATP-binding protein
VTPLSGQCSAVETDEVGKRFKARWALEHCSISIPPGAITALVGPNGAGKTTLLRVLAGLCTPTTGRANVLGRVPGPDAEFLASIGYLAQEAPLYRRLTVGEHLEMGARLNARWDGDVARERIDALRIPADQRTATLSGGQRAQVALGLALAKRPALLLLDEPVAALDPLARRDFLATLTAAVAAADGALTVLMSSHLIQDLERVCDHLVLLARSTVQLCGSIDEIRETHRLLVGSRRPTPKLGSGATAIHTLQTDQQTRTLARITGEPLDPTWQVDQVNLEEILLAYMSEATVAALGPAIATGGAR